MKQLKQSKGLKQADQATGWTEPPALRVVAADDSAVMRGLLKTVFQLHAESAVARGDLARTLPRMELCEVVRDGVEALEAVARLRPDVLLLDLEMPRMGGLEVLEHLRGAGSTLPVIMCSAYTERGARATLDALSRGAKDYVTKPGQQRDYASALDSLMGQLLPKIAELASARPAACLRQCGSGTRRARPSTGPRVEVVVIGVSTGGPSALELMLPMLPHDLAVPVLIVQHMPRLFTGALAERLDRMCGLRVQQACDGAEIAPGSVWLAPGDAHMEVSGQPGQQSRVRLHQGPALNHARPSVDYLFGSAARVYGVGTLALVMTGMGADGLDGCRAVRDREGTVLAQDEASSAVWGMPGRVVRAGLAHSVHPLAQLAQVLVERVQVGRMMPQEAAVEGYAPAGLPPAGVAEAGFREELEVNYGHV